MKTSTSLIVNLMLILSIINLPAKAQWSPAGKMGSGPIDGCFSFTINGKGYVGGGTSGHSFYQYDTTTSAWTLKGNAPGNKLRGWAYSFVLNGKGYVIGGDTTGNFNECAEVWAYNPDSNSWTQKNNFPGGPRDAGFCFAINDTGYLGCGFDGSGVWNDMWKYNPAADSWTALGAVPFGHMLFPATFVLNNKGYVATGEANEATEYEVSTLWEYTPSGDTWTQRADFPGTARQTAFSFVLNGMAYVGGGQAGYTTVYSDMWKYNPTGNSWSNVGNIPTAYPAWSTAFAIGNTGYMGTGVYFGASSLIGTDSFHKYKPVATDVNELSKTGKIYAAFPNPANDYVDINGLNGTETIAVYDVTGRIVKAPCTVINKCLYIGNLKAGVYRITIQNDKEVNTLSVIKE